MSKIIKSMLAVAAVFTVISASAQPQRGERSPEERGKARLEEMAEKLNLTEAQQKQIEDLHKEMRQQMGDRPERPSREDRKKGEKPSEEEIQKMKAERQAMMEQHKAKMEEHDGKLKAILTPEQYEQWKSEANEARKEGPRMHDRKKGNDKRHDRKATRKACDGECKCSKDKE